MADVAVDLLRLSPHDIVGDVAGMEQDLEYVRHVLLIFRWPVAPSDDVYDILDDAARRDMVRGTERWTAEEVAAAEVPQVVFALECAVLERALEEICREFAEVEEERALSRQRRLSANGAAEGVCAGKAPGGGLRKGGSGTERRWLPRRLNF
ncbi:unnamed protein product [Closterium sp. NIES-64]|nr:unnamed protein product [Closterium sp. NIES-64]